MDQHSKIAAGHLATGNRKCEHCGSNALNLALINMVVIVAIILAGSVTVSLAFAQGRSASAAEVHQNFHPSRQDAG